MWARGVSAVPGAAAMMIPVLPAQDWMVSMSWFLRLSILHGRQLCTSPRDPYHMTRGNRLERPRPGQLPRLEDRLLPRLRPPFSHGMSIHQGLCSTTVKAQSCSGGAIQASCILACPRGGKNKIASRPAHGLLLSPDKVACWREPFIDLLNRIAPRFTQLP